MNLVLSLLSLTALTTAAPSNYTTHFQIFQDGDWTTDPPPSSTDPTIDTRDEDTAGHFTDTLETTHAPDSIIDTISGGNLTEVANNDTLGSIYAEDDDFPGTTSVVSGSSADGEISSTDETADEVSSLPYFTNGITYTDVVTSGTDDVTSVTETATDAASEADEATEATIADVALASVFRLGSPYSVGEAVDITSGSTYTTESVTSSEETSTFATDETTFPTDDATLSADASTVSTNEATFTADGSTFSTDGSRFSKDGSTFSTDGSTFSTDDLSHSTSDATQSTDWSRFSTDGSAFSTDGSTFSTDGSTFSTDGSTFSTDGSTFSTDGSTFSTDGSTFSTDGSTFSTNDLPHSISDATQSTDGSRFSTDGSTFSTDGSTFSTDDLSYSTSDATQSTDGASNITDDVVTEEFHSFMSRRDVSTEVVEFTTETETETTTVEANEDIFLGASTETETETTIAEANEDIFLGASTETESGIQETTRFPAREESSGDQANSTKIETGAVEKPGFGFSFEFPAFFTTILQSVPEIVTAGLNTSSEILSNLDNGNADSEVISNSQDLNEGLTIDSTQSSSSFNGNISYTTTASPIVGVASNSFNPSEAENFSTSLSSSDAISSEPSSSGQNFLSTSDFSDHQTPLHLEDLTRVKRSFYEPELSRNQGYESSTNQGDELSGNQGYELSANQGYELSGYQGYESNTNQGDEFSGNQGYESNTNQGDELSGYQGYESNANQGDELHGNQGDITYSGYHSSPDYHELPHPGTGTVSVDTYEYTHNSQSYPSEKSPDTYQESNPNNGNSGSPTGLFQYIIRTSNLPGVLASFPAFPNTSAGDFSSTGTVSSQDVSAADPQTNVGHVELNSQQPTHSLLVPEFENSDNYNFATNPETSSGLDTSSGGSSLPGYQHTSVESGSRTPDVTFYSDPTASHKINQQTNTGLDSGTQDENLYHEETNQFLSTDDSLESLIGDENSFSTTESSSFDSSESTPAWIDGVDVESTTTDGIYQEESTDKPVGIF